MPPLKRKRAKPIRLDRGGAKVRYVVSGQGKKLWEKRISFREEAALIAKAPIVVERPSTLPRTQSSGNYLDVIGPGEEIDLELLDGSGQDVGEEQEINPALDVIRKRSNPQRRQKHFENWAKTEEMATTLLLGGNIGACNCYSKSSKSVRHVGLLDYDIRAVTYCNCSRGAAASASSGFFPSTPIRPGTVFSIDLLELLQEQCLRAGSMSIYGWGEGLRAFIEKRVGRTIPSFHRLVSVLPLMFFSLAITNVCGKSCKIATTTT